MDSGTITALATVGLLVVAVLGGLFAWIRSNAETLATLKQGYDDLASRVTRVENDYAKDIARVEADVRSAHDRLDGWIFRRGPRA